MKEKTVSHRERGFSLVEIMATVAISGFIILATMTALLNVKHQEADMGRMLELASIDAVAVQTSRNFSFISQNLILSPGGSRNTALDGCLVGTPTIGLDCATFNMSAPQVLTAEGITNQSATHSSTDVIITGQRICSSASCSEIIMKVKTTQHLRAGAGDRVRDSEAHYPARSFAPIRQLDFTCANTSVVTSINLTNRIADCSPIIVGQQCADQGPMNAFGQALSCQAKINNTCAYGLSTVGLYAGNGSCNPPQMPGSVLPVVPPVTPAPPVPPVTPVPPITPAPPLTPPPTATPTPTPSSCHWDFVYNGPGGVEPGPNMCYSCPNGPSTGCNIVTEYDGSVNQISGGIPLLTCTPALVGQTAQTYACSPTGNTSWTSNSWSCICAAAPPSTPVPPIPTPTPTPTPVAHLECYCTYSGGGSDWRGGTTQSDCDLIRATDGYMSCALTSP